MSDQVSTKPLLFYQRKTIGKLCFDGRGCKILCRFQQSHERKTETRSLPQDRSDGLLGGNPVRSQVSSTTEEDSVNFDLGFSDFKYKKLLYEIQMDSHH